MMQPNSSHPAAPLPFLSVRGMSLSRGAFSLSDLSFSCQRGEIILVLGHNGAGKTTLLRVLAGLLSSVRGSIHRHHRGIAFVSHEPMSYSGLTVRQNLDFFCALECRSLPEEAIQTWGLTPHIDKPTGSLSRGLTSRLSLVRALTSSAELLLFDEPTSNLDDRAASLLGEELRRRAAQGDLLILATHDLTRLLPIASRVLVLQSGTLLADSLLADSQGSGGLDAALTLYHQSNR